MDVGGTVVQISAGYRSVCALLDTGNVRCWGQNYQNQRGYGNNEDIGDDELPSSAGDVDVGGTVLQVAAGGTSGYEHVCVLLDTAAVRCWGVSDDGMLGYDHYDFDFTDRPPSTYGDVDVGGPVAQIAVGGGNTCALFERGSVRCWGIYSQGLLGNGITEGRAYDEPAYTSPDACIEGFETSCN